jgi:hypothetical protein
MTDQPKRSEEYRAQAQIAAEAAARTPLEQLRAKHTQAAQAWSDLAVQEEHREALREHRAELARVRAEAIANDSDPED